jgi:hypothetical protein
MCLHSRFSFFGLNYIFSTTLVSNQTSTFFHNNHETDIPWHYQNPNRYIIWLEEDTVIFHENQTDIKILP